MLLQATPNADRCTSPCSCNRRCKQQSGGAQAGRLQAAGRGWHGRSVPRPRGGVRCVPAFYCIWQWAGFKTSGCCCGASRIEVPQRLLQAAAGGSRRRAPWLHSRRRWACAMTRSAAYRTHGTIAWVGGVSEQAAVAWNCSARTLPGVPGSGWSSWLFRCGNDPSNMGCLFGEHLPFSRAEHGLSTWHG